MICIKGSGSFPGPFFLGAPGFGTDGRVAPIVARLH